MNKISVIIPVRKKEPLIHKTIKVIPNFCEIIIVTNDLNNIVSLDKIKKKYYILNIEKNDRASLMNEGTYIAKGDIFFFIHPDTVVDKKVFKNLQIMPKNKVWGGVYIRFDNNHMLLKIIAWGSNNIRMKLFHIIYWDQSIFVRKDIFKYLDWYKPMEIFEDFEFSWRLKKQWKLIFFSFAMTSARRFLKKGIIKQFILNWYLVILYKLWVLDKKLRKYYGK